MTEPSFYEELVAGLDQRRAGLPDADEKSFFNRPMTERELVEWLSFEAYYEYCMRALARRGVTSIDTWRPEPEWEEWIDRWYPSGHDTIERVAAHNLAGERGAGNAFNDIKLRVPDDVVKTLDRISPDEHLHMEIGRRVVDTYAVTEDQRERVRQRVMHTFELEQHGRAAYNRRMARLGPADPGDPTPPLGDVGWRAIA